MPPTVASRIAQRCRRLLTSRILTPHDYAVLDALLWRCRRQGRADLIAPYAAIARLAGVCRDTAINAVRKLIDLGIIARAHRRVRVMWTSRQAANLYTFATESAAPPVPRGITRFKHSYVPPVRTVAEQIAILRSDGGGLKV